MKRYRFVKFGINSTRSLLKLPNAALPQGQREDILSELRGALGATNFDAKLARYLELDSPNVTVVTEYYKTLHDTADAYACGYFYAALTSACCLGERILNVLILELRDYYQDTPLYNRVHKKDSFQNWDLAINVLAEWEVLNGDLVNDYTKLSKIRTNAIHLKGITEFQPEAREAIQLVMKITGNLFGLNERRDIFFWVPGEPYIRKDKETEPIVQKFFTPNCLLLGYKHTVGGKDNQFVFQDDNPYEDREVSDEEFKRLRETWRQTIQQSKTP